MFNKTSWYYDIEEMGGSKSFEIFVELSRLV